MSANEREIYIEIWREVLDTMMYNSDIRIGLQIMGRERGRERGREIRDDVQ